MRILAAELWRCELELVRPLRTSAAHHGERPVVLVRLSAEDGLEGWGECGALAEPTYTAEYADGAQAVLAAHLLPRLLAGGPLDECDPIADGIRRMSAVRGHEMAKAAVEMALYDASLRGAGRSLADFLGAVGATVPAGATISLSSVSEAVAAAAEAVAAGYRRVKVKVAPGHDVEPLAELRRSFPELQVAADANGAYRLAVAEHRAALAALDGLGLVALEQPLEAFDLAGHAALCAQLATPVLLDESVGGLGDLEVAIELGALGGLSVKPGRLGGIAVAVEAIARCRAAGLHAAVGGLLESGLGRAAHLAVAALPGVDLAGDLGASDRYFAPDLTDPHVLVDGELAVPGGAGLGRRPDPAVLAATGRLLGAFPGLG